MKQLKLQSSQGKKSSKSVWIISFILMSIVGGIYLYKESTDIPKLNPANYIEYSTEINPTTNNIEIPQLNPYEKEKRKVDWKSINATAIYAFNPTNGYVYYQRNIDKELPIASITKLATVLALKERYSNEENITIKNIFPVYENNLGIKVGDSIKVSELYQCLLIASKNDCATAIPSNYSTTDIDINIIDDMNRLAKTLNMNSTNFSNTSGYINDNNYSTASDLGKLASVATRYSDIVKTTDLSSEVVKINRGGKIINIPISSTNLMLAENSAIKGLKTGFTYQSGECLILYYDFGGSEKLISIVLNAQDRFKQSRELHRLIVNAYN